ncbi:unnamed protein product [Anisakis simplex]|uniref:DBP10 C-terminal domain-containing protein n=1 Tax=Anisakis simplex TaxID=6269 RepID=A0A3P6PAT6_ANISI|nr:unnamed protein product [Anisakis simplex]
MAVNGDRGFGADLMANTIEMCADDVTEMHKQENRKKWDRKRKRFVAESSEHPSKKRVRTEDGTYVPATYRSGRYEKWQSKQKIGYRNEDNNSDDNDNDKASRNKQQFNNRSRGRDRNKKMPNVVVKRSELKNPDQILKQRRKKESIRAYQSHRRDENLKKKTGRSNKQRS